MSDQTTISKIKYRKETVKVKIALSREQERNYIMSVWLLGSQ